MSSITPTFTNDELEFSYLFPYRKTIPTITSHPFSSIYKSKDSIQEYILKTMMNPDYFGWTCKILFNIELFPVQIAILQMLWKTPFPILVATRGGSKSFILALYILLKCIFDQGIRVVIVGAGLRQAKVVFGYVESIWKDAPMFRHIIGGGNKAGPKQGVDQCYFNIGRSKIVALPLGDGSKIRGFRANIVIADEMASIPSDVFDIVVRGFVATSKSPIDDAKRMAIEKKLKEHGLDPSLMNRVDEKSMKGNQIIYSGTAFYAFNHFAQKYETWKKIINSRGDINKIAEIFGAESNIPNNFNWKDYAIIRVPYTHVPEGLLDQRQLANAKATLPKSIFNMEYGCVFVSDSDGFFPRSLIESCTPSPSNGVLTVDGLMTFSPRLFGDKGRKYVMGIDPAGDVDNLGIVLIEVQAHHSRIVYCWSINKKDFAKLKQMGHIQEQDYYAYCCTHIKKVYKQFMPSTIEMDSQGGGKVIAEMLRNKDMLADGDVPIYEIIDRDDPKPTDGEFDGPHIIHLVNQSNEWNSDSNIFLHKAFESRYLLFPAFDPIKMQSALMVEKTNNIVINTYEDCVQEIEELKNEICMIKPLETPGGKPKFAIPELKTITDGVVKKGRRRKDRYTALLLAYRHVHDVDLNIVPSIDYDDVAGNFEKVAPKPTEGMYRGPGIGRMRNADWTKNVNTGATKNGERI